MTDMRRTVLWVVFTMSLVLLWDGWQKPNGPPPMFSPAAPKPAAVGVAPGAASTVPAPAGVAGAAVPGSAVAAPAAGEKLLITTDVLKVSLDTLGGEVSRVELLKYLNTPEPGLFDPLLQIVGLQKKSEVAPQPIVLLDPAHSYKAQSGLVGSKGEQLPTHNTLMSALPGDRSLKDGADELVIKLESPEVGGVK